MRFGSDCGISRRFPALPFLATLAAPTVAGRLLEGITDGSIVLMHPNAETVQAVEIVLDRLSGRGIKYEPVCQIAEPSLPPVLPG